jgi:hypothetical protein
VASWDDLAKSSVGGCVIPMFAPSVKGLLYTPARADESMDANGHVDVNGLPYGDWKAG